jgi:hypothetical protein
MGGFHKTFSLVTYKTEELAKSTAEAYLKYVKDPDANPIPQFQTYIPATDLLQGGCKCRNCLVEDPSLFYERGRFMCKKCACALVRNPYADMPAGISYCYKDKYTIGFTVRLDENIELFTYDEFGTKLDTFKAAKKRLEELKATMFEKENYFYVD